MLTFVLLSAFLSTTLACFPDEHGDAECLSNGDCRLGEGPLADYAYDWTDLCLMNLNYAADDWNEGFCWDYGGYDCKCQVKKSYHEPCQNAAGHYDNNNC